MQRYIVILQSKNIENLMKVMNSSYTCINVINVITTIFIGEMWANTNSIQRIIKFMASSAVSKYSAYSQ